MAITYNQHSWLRFLGVNDVSYNDLTDFCNGEKWCYPVDDSLISKFQLAAGVGPELVANNTFGFPLASGNVTAFTVNKLRDGGATFNSDNIVANMSAVNQTDDTVATITAIDSDIQLTLDADIFPSPDLDAYEVSGWVESGEWKVNRTADPGVAKATAGAGSLLIWGQNILVQNRFYEITFTVSSYTAGTVNVFCGNTAGTPRASIGTFTEVLRCEEVGVFALNKNGAGVFEITSVSVKEVDDIFMLVADDDTGVTNHILDVDVDFFYEEKTIRANLDWSSFGLTTDTCHKICTYLSDQEILNDFSFNLATNGFPTGWSIVNTSNASIGFVDGTAEYSISGSPSTATLRNSSPLTLGKKYIVRYRVFIPTDVTFQAFCGSGGAGVLRSTTGTFSEEITCSGTTVFDFVINGSTGSSELVVEWISVIEVEDFDRCSECFHYLTAQNSALIFTFENDENAFGFDYESSSDLEQQIMLTSRIGKENFPEELDDHLDSASVRKLLFGQSLEVRELIYGEMPRHLHRAIAIAWLHDTISITETPTSTIEYIKVPGDWDPGWEDFRNIAPVIIDVSISDQADTTNANC